MPNHPRVIAICSRVALLLVLAGAAGADTALFDPSSGYRLTQYRAPIPAPPAGIAALTTAEVVALSAAGARLLDVNPLRQYRIAEDGHWIHAEPHDSLPGALWLPVVGWGRLEPGAEAYLSATLARHVAKGTPVIVFCRQDCWLSWNAVQRVRDLGHEARWYPGGVDDWRAQGRTLVPVAPVPWVR